MAPVPAWVVVDGRADLVIMVVAREWVRAAATSKQSLSNDQPGGYTSPSRLIIFFPSQDQSIIYMLLSIRFLIIIG
jgi:hypothetical protein